MSIMPGANSQTASAVFKVRIIACAGGSEIKPPCNGRLEFAAEQAVLFGRAPTSGLPYPLCGRAVNTPILLSNIVNVIRDDRQVSFDQINKRPEQAGTVLRAASGEDAEEIVRLLPTATTPQFIERLEAQSHYVGQRATFAANLQAAAPRAFVTPAIAEEMMSPFCLL